MKDVRGMRCWRPFFISVAGIVRVLLSIQSFRNLATSPGRSIDVSEKRNRMRMRSGASAMIAITAGNSCQGNDGIDLTTGDAKTRLTRLMGL